MRVNEIRQWCEKSIRSMDIRKAKNPTQREWLQGYLCGLGDIVKVIQEAEAREAEKPRAVFIKAVDVVDPDSGEIVEVEIWKDPEANALFGIDATYLDQVAGGEMAEVQSPFNPEITLLLPAPAEREETPPEPEKMFSVRFRRRQYGYRDISAVNEAEAWEKARKATEGWGVRDYEHQIFMVPGEYLRKLSIGVMRLEDVAKPESIALFTWSGEDIMYVLRKGSEFMCSRKTLPKELDMETLIDKVIYALAETELITETVYDVVHKQLDEMEKEQGTIPVKGGKT